MDSPPDLEHSFRSRTVPIQSKNGRHPAFQRYNAVVIPDSRMPMPYTRQALSNPPSHRKNLHEDNIHSQALSASQCIKSLVFNSKKQSELPGQQLVWYPQLRSESTLNNEDPSANCPPRFISPATWNHKAAQYAQEHDGNLSSSLLPQSSTLFFPINKIQKQDNARGRPFRVEKSKSSSVFSHSKQTVPQKLSAPPSNRTVGGETPKASTSTATSGSGHHPKPNSVGSYSTSPEVPRRCFISKSQTPQPPIVMSKAPEAKNAQTSSAWPHKWDLSEVNQLPIPDPKWTPPRVLLSRQKSTEIQSGWPPYEPLRCKAELSRTAPGPSSHVQPQNMKKSTSEGVMFLGDQDNFPVRTGDITDSPLRMPSITSDGAHEMIELPDFAGILDCSSSDEDSVNEPIGSPNSSSTSNTTSLGDRSRSGSCYMMQGLHDDNAALDNSMMADSNRGVLRKQREPSGFRDQLLNGPVLQSIEVSDIWDGPESPDRALLEGNRAHVEGDGPHYEVEKVRGAKRVDAGKLKFLIQWVGYTKREWIPAENCFCPDRIQAFRDELRQKLQAARRDGNNVVIETLQQLLDAGVAHELDTHKFPKGPGLSFGRRNLDGKFQAPGLGNSTIEVVRDATIPPRDGSRPRNRRVNTARLPVRRERQHHSALADGEENEVVWISTEEVRNPQPWRNDSPEVKREDALGVADGDDDHSTADAVDDLSISNRDEELERQEIGIRIKKEADEAKRRLAAEKERGKLLQKAAEIERKTKELQVVKKELETAKRERAEMEIKQRETELADLFERRQRRQTARKKVLEAVVLKSCTKNLSPTPPIRIQQPQTKTPVPQRSQVNNKKAQPTPPHQLNWSLERRTIISIKSPPPTTHVPTPNARATLSAIKRPLVASSTSKDGGVVRITALRPNTARRPVTAKVTKPRGERSASSRQRSVVRHKFENAFDAEKKRKATEMPSSIRSEFRKEMGPKQIKRLTNHDKKPPELPPRQFYN